VQIKVGLLVIAVLAGLCATATGATASGSRPHCERGYRLNGNQRVGFQCSRSHRRYSPPICSAGYQLRHVHEQKRHVAEGRGICIALPPSPLRLSGSVSNVHFLSGYHMEATYSVSGAGCARTNCAWYPHAFELPASQPCEFGNGIQKWIFKGATYDSNGTENRSVEFNKYFPSIRICLFVEHESQQLLVAEAVFDTVHPSVPITPLTVNNVCSFNPGLGTIHESGPLVYWDTNGDGVAEFGAVNYTGDSAVDMAFVLNAGVIAWVGFCYPHETTWLNAQQLIQQAQQQQQQQQLQQQLVSPQMPSSGLTPASLSAVEALDNARDALGSNIATYEDPDPSVGTVEYNDGQCGYGPSLCTVVDDSG
jgi:hypothetical protein